MRCCKTLAGMAVAGMLAGCGGGGGGSAGSTSAGPVFGLPALTAASFASPGIAQYLVSGDCTGAEIKLRDVLTPATFGGQSASGVTTTTDRILVNCPFAGSTSSWQTSYYDANFSHLGADNSSGAVAVSDAPWALPATARPGDSGTYGGETIYADSTRAKVLSHATYTYAVQPDTPATALAILTTTETDPSGNVLVTEKASYQLRQDVSAVLLSIDYQYATTANLHLLYTPGAAAIIVPAGSVVTLGTGQMLLVPAGTSVTTANGNTADLVGHQSTITASAGALVTVPAGATGTADNVVMAR